jgi:hypothetical protein
MIDKTRLTYPRWTVKYNTSLHFKLIYGLPIESVFTCLPGYTEFLISAFRVKEPNHIFDNSIFLLVFQNDIIPGRTRKLRHEDPATILQLPQATRPLFSAQKQGYRLWVPR